MTTWSSTNYRFRHRRASKGLPVREQPVATHLIKPTTSAQRTTAYIWGAIFLTIGIALAVIIG